MRARMAIIYCLPPSSLELREVVLKDKPEQLLSISPKATVPVLQLTDGTVIDESLDIMHFALAQNTGLKQTLFPSDLQETILKLIEENDGEFKWALDRYKYSDRYDESQEYYRQKAEPFLQKLNDLLEGQSYLFAELSLADLAIFPFVRQFAHVDKKWFDASPYNYVKTWLTQWLESDEFNQAMPKFKKWQPDSDKVYFP